MKTRTTITLKNLHCVKESDGSGHSEPYIWPVLIKVDDDTLSTPQLVSLITRSNEHERDVIKSEIRAGESAAIPPPLNTMSVLFENEGNFHLLILAVVVWEVVETPEDSVQAGFQAFASEFEDAIRDNLGLLVLANDDDRETIIAEIKTRIKNKVRIAIENSLSAIEKAKVYARILNLDDVLGNSFQIFTNPTTQPQDFGFSTSNADAHNGRATEFYEITGSLAVQPIAEEKCPVQADAVKDARAQVKGIEQRIRSLQEELRHASPRQKPVIIREIRRIRKDELSDANSELNAAIKALELCHKRNQLFGEVNEDVEVHPIIFSS